MRATLPHRSTRPQVARVRWTDILTIYGRQDRVAELDARSRGSAGDAAHVTAVSEQERVEAEEDERERVP